MSRTYAHRPPWVQQFDPAEGRRTAHDHRDGRCVVETLADARRWATSRPRGGSDQPTCTQSGWGYFEYCRRRGAGVPRWFVQMTWTRPDRARARAACRAAAAAANTRADDVELDELDVESPQHRHRAFRQWW